MPPGDEKKGLTAPLGWISREEFIGPRLPSGWTPPNPLYKPLDWHMDPWDPFSDGPPPFDPVRTPDTSRVKQARTTPPLPPKDPNPFPPDSGNPCSDMYIGSQDKQMEGVLNGNGDPTQMWDEAMKVFGSPDSPDGASGYSIQNENFKIYNRKTGQYERPNKNNTEGYSDFLDARQAWWKAMDDYNHWMSILPDISKEGWLEFIGGLKDDAKLVALGKTMFDVVVLALEFEQPESWPEEIVTALELAHDLTEHGLEEYVKKLFSDADKLKEFLDRLDPDSLKKALILAVEKKYAAMAKAYQRMWNNPKNKYQGNTGPCGADFDGQMDNLEKDIQRQSKSVIMGTVNDWSFVATAMPGGGPPGGPGIVKPSGNGGGFLPAHSIGLLSPRAAAPRRTVDSILPYATPVLFAL